MLSFCIQDIELEDHLYHVEGSPVQTGGQVVLQVQDLDAEDDQDNLLLKVVRNTS